MRKTSFYFSFLALPAPKRAAITAVFDVCRVIDDCVDLEPDPAKGMAALHAWREEIDRVFTGRTPATPEGRQLQPFVESCHLPREQFEALIDGVAMDATPRRYQTFDALEPYCHRVASSVGLMCAEIFEYREPAVLDYARDLGVALQLTNILRDVGVDYRRGRLYLPLDDLARFGCTEADIARELDQAGPGVRSEKVRAVLEHHAARARVYYARARRALPGDHRRRFVAAEIMHAVYWDLLSRIEAAGCDVFTDVIRAPRAYQAWLAMRTWLRT
jgi:phytoene synthase